MKYHIRGGGTVSLTQRDFVARGGEGEVFGRGRTIYKIYLNPAKMIPEGKIRELRVLERDNILKPDAVILDSRNTPVGFTMAWMRDAVALSRLFTNDFRTRHGIRQADILDLVTRIRETIRYIHTRNCLMVDGNEFNYLVDLAAGMRPCFIDVDSYQTPGYPATAIMPTIRDWHARGFSEQTDWYAFGVITCLLFVGIHPYKGKHPDFKKGDLKRRARARVSIFNPAVSLPPAARDPRSIPRRYHAWLVDLFENGLRAAPPDSPGAVVVPAPQPAAQSGPSPRGTRLRLTLLRTLEREIVRHLIHAGTEVIWTDREIRIADQPCPATPDTEVLFTPRGMQAVLVRITDGRLSLIRAGGGPVAMPALAARAKTVVANTLYVRSGGQLTEIGLADGGARIVPAIRNVWEIMPHAAMMLDGLVYQSVLGQPYLVLPSPGNGAGGACRMLSVPELAGYRILHGRHRGGVCMLVGHRNGRYDRIEIKLARERDAYAHRIIPDVDPLPPSFVTLDKGVVVSIAPDDTLEVFSARPDKPEITRISDPAVHTGVTLSRSGNTVMLFSGPCLYAVRMTR